MLSNMLDSQTSLAAGGALDEQGFLSQVMLATKRLQAEQKQKHEWVLALRRIGVRSTVESGWGNTCWIAQLCSLKPQLAPKKTCKES